jgi:3-isopropylmalate dehydrogenase
MNGRPEFRIAVIPGDGIGLEIMDCCLAVLDAVEQRVGGYKLTYKPYRMGAAFYAETGIDMSDEDFDAMALDDAILLGAIGDPAIRNADGTEISPHLRIRTRFSLCTGLRPAKAYPNAPRRLSDARAADIDLVVVRESTEGLFNTALIGEVIDDREAIEVMKITRPVCEQLFDETFALARRRQARGGKGKVTCVDKANVFKAMAFFRKIFDERSALNPGIEVGYNYVDAQALDFIRRPWDFDVLVMENMFGDILSDLAAALVGGMGMAPCGEIGRDHAMFQPAHGSAPDIAGQDKANPIAMILSAAMMLEWLGVRHGVDAMTTAAEMVDDAVNTGFATRRINPAEFGGPQGTQAVTRSIVDIINEGAASTAARH